MVIAIHPEDMEGLKAIKQALDNGGVIVRADGTSEYIVYVIAKK